MKTEELNCGVQTAHRDQLTKPVRKLAPRIEKVTDPKSKGESEVGVGPQQKVPGLPSQTPGQQVSTALGL